VLALGVIIAQKSETRIYENHPCLFLLSFGLVGAKVTNRLVVRIFANRFMAEEMVKFLFLVIDLIFSSHVNRLMAEEILNFCS